MSKHEEKHVLDRLVRVAWAAALDSEIRKRRIVDDEHWNVDTDTQIYQHNNLWPGDNYILAGHSYFAKFHIIGTELEVRRVGHIALVCQQKGNRYHLATVSDALSYEGFADCLDEDEREWLESLPDDTLIGPAYDKHGHRIPTAFAIWRTLDKEAPVHVEIARR